MFDTLVGQENAKRKLKFYAETHKATGVSPFLLFQGSKGVGKTAFTRAYAKNVAEHDGKSYAEINCASIKNNRQFFENIYPQMSGSKVITFFDEAHELPYDLQNDFLTILNSEKDTSITYNWRGTPYYFDFTSWNFLFGTTDPQKLSSALRDRMTTVDFEDYSISEMGEIIKKHCGLTFDDGLLEEIAETCRGNPRSSVLRAKDIKSYCDQFGAAHFDRASWEELKKELSILPYGLTNDEFKLLKILRQRGECTLTNLCSVTGNTRGYTQMLESYLLKHGLMNIDGSPVKRMLSAKGMKIA